MRFYKMCVYIMLVLKIISVESNQDCILKPSGINVSLPKDLQFYYPEVDKATLRQNEHQIFGGKHVQSIKQFPYMAYLVRFVNSSSKESNHWCGATILSPKHLLTAAHCLISCTYILAQDQTRVCLSTTCREYDNTLFKIYVGSVVPKNAKATSKIKRWFINPNFKYCDFENKCTLNYDIAVVELRTKLRFNNQISNIRLPPPITKNGVISTISARIQCQVIGWGYTSVKEYIKPVSYLNRQLKFEQVNLIDNKNCVSHLKIVNQTMNLFDDRGFCRFSNLCTLDPNKKTFCGGDSGGPLVCDGVLVGVASSGARVYKCVGPHVVDIYAKVDVSVEWIRHIISIVELPMWLDFPVVSKQISG